MLPGEFVLLVGEAGKSFSPETVVGGWYEVCLWAAAEAWKILRGEKVIESSHQAPAAIVV